MCPCLAYVALNFDEEMQRVKTFLAVCPVMIGVTQTRSRYFANGSSTETVTLFSKDGWVSSLKRGIHVAHNIAGINKSVIVPHSLAVGIRKHRTQNFP